MKYFGVVCKACSEVFVAVAEANWGEKGIVWPSTNYRESLTCPECGATCEYTYSDLAFYEGEPPWP
jgi:hypothetical protein